MFALCDNLSSRRHHHAPSAAFFRVLQSSESIFGGLFRFRHALSEGMAPERDEGEKVKSYGQEGAPHHSSSTPSFHLLEMNSLRVESDVKALSYYEDS